MQQPQQAADGPEQHLLSLLHDGDRCLAEARLSLRRAARLKEALQEEGTRCANAVLSL